MNFRGAGRFTAYSAGSYPGGTVRQQALEQLEQAKIPTHGLRSKSWDEFNAVTEYVLEIGSMTVQSADRCWTGR